VLRGEVARGVALPDRVDPLDCDGRVRLDGERPVGGDVVRADVDGVVVLHLPQMGTRHPGGDLDTPMIEALRDALVDLPSATPVVLDLRGNRGGFQTIGDWLAGVWLDEGTLLRTCVDRTGPGLDDVTAPREVRVVRAPGHPVLTGPVAVIQDGLTYGGAEYLGVALKSAGRGLLVGDISSGSFGVAFATDEGELGGFVSGRACTGPGGASLEGKPPAVDVPAAHTVEALSEGRDAVLEAALDAVRP
ncbi:MAG: hypothetical protein KC656_28915, partial [Myxococcales bacterium]|nr:hypothetical protein [Myxococcales bacterium]